jgi:hypothetical protein
MCAGSLTAGTSSNSQSLRDDEFETHSAADHRGFSGRHRAAMAVAGSRCHLRGRVPAPCRRHGHHGGHHQSIKSLAESVCGAIDRIHTSGVFGSRHCPQPGASAAHDRSVYFLLSWGKNSSLPREGRTRAASRPSTNGRSRRGVRASWWPSSSVRATRRLTRPVTPGCNRSEHAKSPPTHEQDTHGTSRRQSNS